LYLENIVKGTSNTKEKRDLLRSLAAIEETRCGFTDKFENELCYSYTKVLKGFTGVEYHHNWIDYAKNNPSDNSIHDEVVKIVGFAKLKKALKEQVA
jgi:hypothetical protein